MKSKEVNFEDIIGIICEKLENGGTVSFTPHGTSMEPMLHGGKDEVELAKPCGRLSKNDVALYRRSDGHYVLHRVIGFDKNGGYIFCGDNQFAREYGITDENVIATMLSFCRNGKKYTVTSKKYRAFCAFWHYTRFVRRVFRGVKRRISSLFKLK